jgi:hypothetical protein
MEIMTIQGKNFIALNEAIYWLFLLIFFLASSSSIVVLIISAIRYAKHATCSKKLLLFSVAGFIVGLLMLIFLIKGPIIITPLVPFHDGSPVPNYGG